MAKKKSTADVVLDVEDTKVETPVETIAADEIVINETEVKESIENVDTTIESNVEENIAKIAEQIKEEVKPIQEVKDQLKDFSTAQSELNEVLTNNPEKAEEYIKNEIKKVEALQANVEKIIKNTDRKLKAQHMTNWWNGMGYDF